MRDFRDAKAMADSLRTALADMDPKITVAQSLEPIAQAFGVADWNALRALIGPEARAVPETGQSAAPESATSSGPISSQLESTLNQAFVYARGRKHEEMTVEHLLLFMIDDPDAAPVMQACGLDLAALRTQLTAYIDTAVHSHATVLGDTPTPTRAFQCVLQRAVYHAKTEGRYPVPSANVMVAIFSERMSRAAKLLNEQGVTRVDAVNFLDHGIIQGKGGVAGGATPTRPDPSALSAPTR